ncbi:MAG TPA: YrdB family protein [Chloroflexia bacterium]|nr:YrdB family protein [Chloroflexia bacterium]
MSGNPVNLGVRFLLELVGLYAFGFYGWQANDGFLRIVLAIGLPLLAAAIWGIFGTTGDNRGAPVIAVPGAVRLGIELIFFVLATLAFYAGGAPTAALVFGVVSLVQNLASYDRMGWLLGH